jgi:ABC-type sugar transport system ATPase subunit
VRASAPEARTANGTPLLEMTGICKDFAGGRVLHDIDFKLEAGEVHALVGANGAGKSTLMKILAGVYPDYRGRVRLRGEELRMRDPRIALRRGVAVIYQEFTLVPDLTVAENIALGREDTVTSAVGFSRRALTQRSADEARALDIDLPMDARVAQLGVAEQQMTEIVKAVGRDASVLVMDEPTARLSSNERDRLFTIIRRLSELGVGIVYVSHFLEEIFSVASRVTVLRDGRRVACEPTAQLDVGRLARLMVGDKYQEISRATKRHLDHAAVDAPLALRLRDVAVDGSVEPVTLDLPRGAVIALAGLEGSGRTELVEAIVGARRGARGEIETRSWRGLPRSPREAAAAGILMLPADRKNAGLLTVRPVSENVTLSALRDRLTRLSLYQGRLARSVVEEMLERFSVQPPDPRIAARSLSGGNQQKVIVARAVAAQAEVLVLDQPTAGVDIGAKVELYDQLDRLTASGVGMLLVSDDLTELLRLADWIVFMRDGVASEPRPAADFDRASLLEALTGGRSGRSPR